MKKDKKQIYKKWWFWLIIVIFIIGTPSFIDGFKNGIKSETKEAINSQNITENSISGNDTANLISEDKIENNVNTNKNEQQEDIDDKVWQNMDMILKQQFPYGYSVSVLNEKIVINDENEYCFTSTIKIKNAFGTKGEYSIMVEANKPKGEVTSIIINGESIYKK